MNQNKPIPDQKTRAKSVERLREISLMFDALNMRLDEAIASVERDIRNNPHNIRRRKKGNSLFESYKQKKTENIKFRGSKHGTYFRRRTKK